VFLVGLLELILLALAFLIGMFIALLLFCLYMYFILFHVKPEWHRHITTASCHIRRFLYLRHTTFVAYRHITYISHVHISTDILSSISIYPLTHKHVYIYTHIRDSALLPLTQLRLRPFTLSRSAVPPILTTGSPLILTVALSIILMTWQFLRGQAGCSRHLKNRNLANIELQSLN
jgi:hypothetical protein